MGTEEEASRLNMDIDVRIRKGKVHFLSHHYEGPYWTKTKFLVSTNFARYWNILPDLARSCWINTYLTF